MNIIDKLISLFTFHRHESAGRALKFDRSLFPDENIDVEKTLEIKFNPPPQQYIVKINGEYSVFKSIDDMPSKIRNSITQLDTMSNVSSSYAIFVDGKRKDFSSFDDMPDDIKRAVRTN